MPEERTRHSAYGQESKKTAASGYTLLAVQGISCLVILLIAGAFRLIGGTAFSQLSDSFNQAIMSNSVIATLTALIDTSSADSAAESEASSEAAAADEGNAATATTTTATTTTTDATLTTTAVAASATTAVAIGGQDIAVDSTDVQYAPKGASFAPLSVSRLACKPLEKGTITSRFGYRTDSGTKSFHQGLDIAADTGTPIAAMYFGVVQEVGKSSSYGNYILLYHGNGLVVLYAHCSEILAQKDAVIKAGENVAKVGSTGDSTGPHVHIEVRLNGVAYDPEGIVPIENYA